MASTTKFVCEEFKENLSSFIKNLTFSDRFHDVSIISCDGKIFTGHRIILAAGSEFFNRIFSNIDQDSPVIFLEGISERVVEQLLNFMYNGRAEVIQDELVTFLSAVKELRVKGITDILPFENNQHNTNKNKPT